MDLFDDIEHFLDWEELEDTLTHERWAAVTAQRRDLPGVTIVTAHHGRLAIHENDVSPAERAELCRWGFVPMTTPKGRCWCWAPPSQTRFAWACARQRDRKVLRVLRDLLHATPAEVIVHLEDDEDELAV